MTDNIFETASREKFRYSSGKGELVTEQLWDLKLSNAGTGFDLDSVARAIAVELESVTEKSFVSIKPNTRKGELAAKLEVLKHIIAVKQAEADKAKTRAANAAKRAKLVEILATKEDENLKGLTQEEILAQIAALED